MKKITKKDKNTLSPTQRAMVNALHEQLGNITAAVAEAGIVRQTHYRWLEESKAYAEAVDECLELELDFAEGALKKQIIAGSTPATKFFLQSKGKRRGYNEKKEIEITGTISEGLTKEQLEETIKHLTK